MTDFEAMAIMLKKGKLLVNTNLIQCSTNKKRQAFKVVFEVDDVAGEKIMGNVSKRMLGGEVQWLPMLVLVDMKEVEKIKSESHA